MSQCHNDHPFPISETVKETKITCTESTIWSISKSATVKQHNICYKACCIIHR